MQYGYIEQDGRKSISVFANGEVYVAAGTHPSFDRILEGAKAGDESIIELFDAGRTAKIKFERLSDRVTVESGHIMFDGDEVDNSLTQQVVRFLDEGVDDWAPLVAFFENVQQNPSENSREELYSWLANDESLTITEDGYIVGYKGCYQGSDGVPTSTREAPASENVRVDDEPVTGLVPQMDGSIVTMPRSEVDPNLNRHCSKGLHVGTYSYAKQFAPVVLEVHVHPRDVVSVTSDSNREKIRTCRYEVVGVVETQHQTAVIPASQGRIDTRENHKSQERYPAGTYIDGVPMGGRFIPVGV